MGAKGKANLANLTPWPKGTSGNPKGRPPSKIISEYARKIAEEIDPETKKIFAHECVEILKKYARKGSLGHLQQYIHLVESDAPGTGDHSTNSLDSDSIAKLIAKICR